MIAKSVDGFKAILSQVHILIAGAAGSGKSVFENNLIREILIDPRCEMVLIDPKRVELIDYKNTVDCIRYASEPEEMIDTIKMCMNICENRYKEMQLKGLKKYLGKQLYIIIDEYADLMSIAKKEVQPIIQRLAQIGRAANIHIILCTQYVSQVVDTRIRCNFDCRIGLHTATKQDSLRIIEKPGLECLPKYGQAIMMCPDGYIHFPNVPMYDDIELAEIIKQRTPKKRFSRLFR